MRPKPQPQGDGERLQKALAQAGYGSRREIEGYIRAGRVRVNGEPAQLGTKVRPGDRIHILGKTFRLPEAAGRARVLIYHKPAGEIVSRRDPQGRPTVFDRLPPVAGGRWVPVGRLDFNTEGLLVFTTAGELANRLMHPRFEVEREYAVRVRGELGEATAARLLRGVTLADGRAKLESLEDAGGRGTNHWYRVVLREGRNREVRRLFEAVDTEVSRLIRVRFGSLALPRGLRRGQWRELAAAEVNALYESLGLSAPKAPSRGSPRGAGEKRAPRRRSSRPR
ncbi:MAG TPA: pseudouridine synthase [Pelomicrobium sp.]|nr:pseudouridine synthase [Pelomicrobium sp.]